MAAAADLSSVARELGQAFQKESGEAVRFAFGGSGALASQIGAGAPFDVYLSANEQFVKDLAAQGKIVPESVRVYAVGRLGLWSKSGRYRGVRELLGPGMKMLALPNPVLAPYGAAARQVLEGSQAWEALKGRTVFGENVIQALQFAGSGNADAVITAWPLVKGKGGVLLPAGGHSPIRQAAGVVAGGKQRGLAERWVRFLGSRKARELLLEAGFDVE